MLKHAYLSSTLATTASADCASNGKSLPTAQVQVQLVIQTSFSATLLAFFADLHFLFLLFRASTVLRRLARRNQRAKWPYNHVK